MRTWRKGNNFALLVGMKIGSGTMENSMEVPQKIKNRITSIPLLGIYSNKMKALTQKDICTPMFIATLFTIARIWKQPKCPLVDK